MLSRLPSNANYHGNWLWKRGNCGMVVGLINDIPSCKELIDGIMSEADSLITKRLEGMLSA